ncbi:MAG: ACT domain-containing protein, partial [Candidatus Subteraquimicrobiales bacterium]|nr:ACT domain-containing protein [Candidatus Subteraquimicrobiales bacterium]
ISSEHPLASVKGVNNAIFIEGDAVGEVMFYGPGAGSLPAASAVVGDILGIASNICFGGVGKIGCTCFEAKRIKPIDEINSSFYLLTDVIDKPGVLARIAKIFGENNVSLASVIQKGPRGTNAELMFITHQTKESNLRKALSEIKELDVVNKICNVIRVEES